MYIGVSKADRKELIIKFQGFDQLPTVLEDVRGLKCVLTRRGTC